jgi:hypothetical protein
MIEFSGYRHADCILRHRLPPRHSADPL